jgi:hypothetical protein
VSLHAFAFAAVLAQATVTRSGGPVETASPLAAATPDVRAVDATPEPGASPIDSSMPSLAIPTPPGTTPAPVLTPPPATGAADGADPAWFWTPFWSIVICLAGFLAYTNMRPGGGSKPPR